MKPYKPYGLKAVQTAPVKAEFTAWLPRLGQWLSSALLTAVLATDVNQNQYHLEAMPWITEEMSAQEAKTRWEFLQHSVFSRFNFNANSLGINEQCETDRVLRFL